MNDVSARARRQPAFNWLQVPDPEPAAGECRERVDNLALHDGCPPSDFLSRADRRYGIFGSRRHGVASGKRVRVPAGIFAIPAIGESLEQRTRFQFYVFFGQGQPERKISSAADEAGEKALRMVECVGGCCVRHPELTLQRPREKRQRMYRGWPLVRV